MQSEIAKISARQANSQTLAALSRSPLQVARLAVERATQNKIVERIRERLAKRGRHTRRHVQKSFLNKLIKIFRIRFLLIVLVQIVNQNANEGCSLRLKSGAKNLCFDRVNTSIFVFGRRRSRRLGVTINKKAIRRPPVDVRVRVEHHAMLRSANTGKRFHVRATQPLAHIDWQIHERGSGGIVGKRRASGGFSGSSHVSAFVQ